jgi:Carboxypeptidase regulatory-like domain
MVLQIASFLLVALSMLQQTPAPTPAPLPQSFRISGTVLDALGGQPLARALVSINLQTERDSALHVITGVDGRFAFENLAAGTYALSARRKGYVEQAYKQHEFFSTAIILGPDRQPGDLRFELRPDASISGQVFDEMNEPVRNAQVMLLHQGVRLGRRTTWQQGQVMTDDQGHYHFGHLPPDTYFVSVTAQPWYAQHVGRLHGDPHPAPDVFNIENAGDPALDVAYPVTFFLNATEISAASPITLHAGVAEISDITLRPVPAIHLVIRYSASSPSEQFWVQRITQHIADGVDLGLAVQTTQSEPGVFEIMGLPPGRMSLGLASSKGNEVTSGSETIQRAGGGEIEASDTPPSAAVKANEPTSRSQILQLTGDTEINASDAPPSATVSGVITMDDGSPLPQPTFLRLHCRATGAVFDAQSQALGEFSFNGQAIPAGIYGVAIGRPPASAVRSMSATGAKISGRTVEIGSSPDVRLSVVISKGSGTVKGFVLKDGKPADGVMIALVPQDPEHNLVLFRRDQSDSDGSFNLRGILPGKYTILAIENGWDLEWFSPAALQKYLAAGEKIQVNANGKLEVKVNVQ